MSDDHEPRSINMRDGREFLFGYEAMKPVLRALGISIDDKEFAVQGITITFGHDLFPVVELTVAPTSKFLNDPAALDTLTSAVVSIIKDDSDGE